MCSVSLQIELDDAYESRLSRPVTSAEEVLDGSSDPTSTGRRRRMNTTLRQTLKSLLYAGATLMILVAGSANWPKH
jgi:hypothetical protein